MREKLSGLPPHWKELWGRYRYILLAVLAGAVLLLMPGKTEQTEKGRTQEKEISFDLQAEEHRLERILSQIQGAGRVTVMLTVKEGTRQVLAKDTRLSEREQSSTAVVVSSGSGQEEPVFLQSIYPRFQGALVVCDGGGDARIKLELLEAMRALTGLGAEKIAVCKRQ